MMDDGDGPGGISRRPAAHAGVPEGLLEGNLDAIAAACRDGRIPEAAVVTDSAEVGWRAADIGVSAEAAAAAFLAAAHSIWADSSQFHRQLTPAEVHRRADALVGALSAAVPALIAAHQSARRDRIRLEESQRREFVDDLLRGDADVASIVERAEPFGLDLAQPHQVAFARPVDESLQVDSVATAAEHAIVARFGDREVLVATKEGCLAIVLPGTPPATMRSVDSAAEVLAVLSDLTGEQTWLVGVGRAYPGAYGVCRSYEEAREANELAARLQQRDGIARAADSLIYRVVIRDRDAIADLVDTLLSPLAAARGGAEPLLNTLETYFSTGAVGTETAQRLGVSPRTVTYRLAKVAALTGYDPTEPDDAYALRTAVLGARLLREARPRGEGQTLGGPPPRPGPHL